MSDNKNEAEAIVEGTAIAWMDYLELHNVSVPDCIMLAVEKAVKSWLDVNADELIAAIAVRCVEQSIAAELRGK
jgi:hypothetical protein